MVDFFTTAKEFCDALAEKFTNVYENRERPRTVLEDNELSFANLTTQLKVKVTVADSEITQSEETKNLDKTEKFENAFSLSRDIQYAYASRRFLKTIGRKQKLKSSATSRYSTFVKTKFK